jgi:hypothetical protein
MKGCNNPVDGALPVAYVIGPQGSAFTAARHELSTTPFVVAVSGAAELKAELT